MISAAAFALLLTAPRLDEVTVSLPVDQDVWVYPHASDPGADPALRVWGVGGKAVSADPNDAEEFSYGLLRVSLANIPDGKKLVGAYLYLKPVGAPEIAANAKDFPLEVRSLTGEFTEKDWNYNLASKIYPGKDIYGSGIIEKRGDNFEIRADLMGKDSKFGAAFDAAVKGKKALYFGLASKVDPAEQGRANVYKVYSRDNKDEADRPKLILRFE